MVCKKCGAVLDEDSMFCISCGSKIEEETEQAMPVCDPVPSAPTTPVVTEEKAKVKKSAVHCAN